jgi:hypothetical protein
MEIQRVEGAMHSLAFFLTKAKLINQEYRIVPFALE